MSTDPNWRRAEVIAADAQLQRLDDFYHGTDAVRARSKVYVPPLELETETKYRARSTAAVAPGAVTRTVDASVGRMFAVAPTLDPGGYAAITDEWQDLDGQGTHGDVWLSRAGVWAVLDGFYLALIDAPQAPAPLVALPDAPQYRPRWIGYRRRQVLNWRTAVIENRMVLTMLALKESAEVKDGAWGLTSEERVRVLRNTGGVITAEVWAERPDSATRNTWQLIEGPVLYDGPTEIPVAVLAAGKVVAPFVVRPPLLALCDKVIEFYRAATNMAHYEQMACFPQPVVVGQLQSVSGDGRLVLGPTSVVNVEAGGDFKWAELSGGSMTQLRENQRDRRQEIGALGLSFLVTETRSAETAKAKTLDNAAENATLADAARGIEDGANVALAHHVSYAGVPADQAPTVSLNKNLSGDVIDAVLLRVLLDMRTAGELTMQEFRELLSRGRIIPSEMAAEDAVLLAEVEAVARAASVGEMEVMA
jgi:hypothetical protein